MEFAILAPLLMLLVIGGVGLQLVTMARTQAQWFAQEGAQAAANEPTDLTRCQAALDAVSAVGGPSGSLPCDSDPVELSTDIGPPTSVTVVVTVRVGGYPLLEPFVATDPDGRHRLHGRAAAIVSLP